MDETRRGYVNSFGVTGALRRDEAVPVLRDVAAGEAGVADVPLRREAVEALAAIGTASSCEALAGLARRRVWPWKRTERGLREMAAAALAARTEEDQDATDG